MRPIDAEMLKEELSEAIKDAPLYIQATVDQYIDEAPTITEPNEPLTLDELRNIGNVPLWLVWGYEMSEWALIRPYDDTYMEALVFDGEGELFRIDEYGEEWKVYRRPPEGDDAK